MATIYILKNSENGKAYAGKTRRKASERWQNGKGYVGNTDLWNDIQKYGWEAFEKMTIEVDDDKAGEVEKSIISALGLQDPERGYNKASGGDIGYSYTDDTRRLMSERKLEKQNCCKGSKWMTSPTGVCRRVAQEQVEEYRSNGWTLGHINLGSEEGRTVYSEPVMPENVEGKVLQFTKSGEFLASFDTNIEASRATGVRPDSISQAIHGISRTAGGYIWRVVR